MRELSLNFLGVRVAVKAHDDLADVALAALKGDFENFLVSQNGTPDISVSLSSDYVQPPNYTSRTTIILPHARAFGSGNRLVKYNDGSDVKLNYENSIWTAEIFSRNFENLWEHGLMTVLSMTGEKLGYLGFHRIHALGVSGPRGAALIALPSGGGKSGMALSLLNTKILKLYSDEIPHLKDGVIYPFPIRLTAHDRILSKHFSQNQDWLRARQFKRFLYEAKRTIQFPSDLIADPAPCNFLLIGRRGTDPKIIPAGTQSALLPLLKSLIIGFETPQMTEFMFRFNFVDLARIAASRSNEALRLLKQVEVYEFQVGQNPVENARVLENFLTTQA